MVMLHALTARVENALPPQSRAPGSFSAHKTFGLTADFDYVVEFDIASCYEYVDHNVLRDELVAQGAGAEQALALAKLLGSLAGTARGLPQLMPASDRLADAYLAILDRAMMRHGWRLNRYVDDYRILSKDWNEANSILEFAVEYAREIGLVLAQDKSGVRRSDRLRVEAAREDGEMRRYFNSATEQGIQIVDIETDYGPQSVIVGAGNDEAEVLAYQTLLEDWLQQRINRRSRKNRDGKTPPELRDWKSAWLGRAVRGVSERKPMLSSEVLSELVFQKPTHMQLVCEYLTGRTEEKRRHELFKLTAQGRGTAWERLWLLNSFASVGLSETQISGRVISWGREQLDDRHEVVRAEAAWLLATRNELTDEDVWTLYGQATDVTSPGLAASATLSSEVSTEVARSLAEESELTAAAAEWATHVD
jgi:hypothetical protein